MTDKDKEKQRRNIAIFFMILFAPTIVIPIAIYFLYIRKDSHSL